MACLAPQPQATPLPFFTQGCNSAPRPLIPPAPKRSPPTEVAKLEEWQEVIESALAKGLARLCPDAFGDKGQMSRDPSRLPRMLRLGQQQRKHCTVSISGDESLNILERCLDAKGFLERLQGACLIEYGGDESAFSKRLLPAVRALGRALPSSVLLLNGSHACGATHCSSSELLRPALQDSEPWHAQLRVLRLSMSIGDFDLAALTRPLSRPLSRTGTSKSTSSTAAEAVPLGPTALPTLELRINGLNGLMCTLPADESMTVGEVKRRVANKLDIPSPQQRVLCGTRQLNDVEKLGSLDVNKDESAETQAQRSVELTLVAQSAERAYWLQVVKRKGEALSSAPLEITKDAEIVTSAVKENGFALKYAARELRADREVVLAAVKKNGMALWCAEESLRAERDVALAAVRQDGLALAHVSEDLQSDAELVRAAIVKKGDALKHASANLRADRGIVLEAVQRDARALQHAASRLYADRDIIHTAVQQEPKFTLERAAEDLRTDRSIALAAIQSHGSALQFLDVLLRSDVEIVMAAVRRSGAALEFAAEHLRDEPEVVMTAVCNNGLALEFASERLRADRDIVSAALQQDASSLSFAAEHLRADRKIVAAAIERNCFAISSVANELRDRELILATVQKNPSALEHATAEMLADRAFLLAVVQKNALALEHIPHDLRGDRLFMLDVVRKNGFALKYATEALRADGEVVLAAVQQDRRAIEYADRRSLMAQIQKKKSEGQSSKQPCQTDKKELRQEVAKSDARPRRELVEPDASTKSMWRVAVEMQAAASSFLIFAQHLCGSQADLALRSLARAEKSSSFMAILSPCCHSSCELASYVNRDFLAEVFPDVAEAFGMLTAFAAGASCAWNANAAEDAQDVGAARRVHIAALSCALLDVGRALWLKETLGWQVELKAYTDVHTSRDKLLIWATQ